MNSKLRLVLIVCLTVVSEVISAKSFIVNNGQTVVMAIDTTLAPVVGTAFEMLKKDMLHVLNARLEIVPYGKSGMSPLIEVRTDHSLRSKGFRLSVSDDGILHVDGADAYGLAYGLLEISRMAGVSPWEWWADVNIRPIKQFKLKRGFESVQSPSVEFRGIFINDEDWGMMPWSYQTYDPAEKGVIGPRTYARIFELLLRLRANYIWPAMHECTRPFFLTEGNRDVARRYGIFIGGSHCEPMACSTAGEWGLRGKGQYNYVTNAEAVRKFWTDRLSEVNAQSILYTIGMRGVHDSGMQGVKTASEKLYWLQKVIDDQRELLAEYVNKDVTQVPQVFIPYKEVQAIYDEGLKVPEDVCLMWCDDNYGYIRHFPTQQERNRKGGNGVYYHVSYWGAPQDYLWLGTFSPSLLFEQMEEAWDRGIQRIWILNVGDLKPCEYQMELFLDMAWNIDVAKSQWAGGYTHLNNFLCREFGDAIGESLLPLMVEYYRLAYVRKPEFMGGTRVYESDRNEWYKIVDNPWTDAEVDRRIAAYQRLEDAVEHLWTSIPADRRDAFFELVKYPVQASAEMNKKFLYAQKARHTGDVSYWQKSDMAYDSIASLTAIYNEGIYNGGKWNHMMDFQPRKLSVFDRVPREGQTPDPSKRAAVTYAIPSTPLCVLNGTDFKGDIQNAYGVGLDGKAVKIIHGATANAFFVLNKADSVRLLVRLVPHFPVIENGTLKVSVSVDGSTPVELQFQTVYHGEQWKEGVIQNYTERSLDSLALAHGKHTVTINAIDDGVILDQVLVMPK